MKTFYQKVTKHAIKIIFRKVITNLKYWGSSEIIISKTLHLLSELSVGYGTVRKLVKLEEVNIDRERLYKKISVRFGKLAVFS